MESNLVCNGVSDCPDKSDEIVCTCDTNNLVNCAGSSLCGQECIPVEWVCDGYSDCPQGSDENNCPRAGYTRGIHTHML